MNDAQGRSDAAPIDRLVVDRGILGEAGLSSVVINLLSLALPLTLLQVYDRILPNQSYGTAGVLMIAVVVAVTLEAFLRYARSWLLGSAASNLEYRLSRSAVTRVLQAHPAEIERLGGGQILGTLNSIGSLRELYAGQAVLALLDLPFAIVFLALVAYIGGWIVVVPIIVWVMTAIFAVVSARRLSRQLSQTARDESGRLQFLLSAFSHLVDIKTLGVNDSVARRFREANFNRLESQRLADDSNVMMREVIQGAAQGTTMMTVLVGAALVLDGQITTGALTACSILAGRAVAPLSALVGLKTRFATAGDARERVQEMLDMPAVSRDQTVAGQAQVVPPGPLVFENVSAARQGSRLVKVSFAIEPGQIGALVATPAVDGSLALALAAGFAEPDQGRVLLSGEPPGHYQESALRSAVGYVPMRPVLLLGTLLDNMTGFRPELEPAALALGRDLGVEEWLRQLPQGYQTRVGGAVSAAFPEGAIKQVALVRALVYRPALLLLDHPAVWLDADGRQRLTQVLAAHKGETSLLISTHEPALIELADVHVRLARGAQAGVS